LPDTTNNPADTASDTTGNFDIIEHVWIEMSDGVRLSAKIWLPRSAAQEAVPAILEFIPYRKRDAVAIRDHRNHAWFAARGYACVRPDMRGHGDSEGIMLDEYLPREQQDAVEVVEWISRQDWCSGSVGMTGLSWGGIVSLQTATHQPSALKAIIPVGASVDRYYDDGAYLVGGYPGQGLGWGGVMFGYCIRPPDPAVVGEKWRDMWMERLEQTPMFAEKWLRHQLRDETWTQGSVCEDYQKIKTPVLGVSGWNDCWPNTMIRLLENISAPCRVVSGPWGHVYPNLGGPGPKIGFLQLSVQWWNHWLKGIENGVMDEPAFLAFIQDSHKPDPNPTERPGRWVGEAGWPSPRVNTKAVWLDDATLADEPAKPGTLTMINSLVSTGLTSGEYMPISGVAELPQDQRADDAKSLCFDGAVLNEPLELLGTPMFHLKVASDKDCGLIVARLCDVAPDGASTLISYGIINLKMRTGREQVAEVVPGDMMDVTVRLNDTGWRLLPGHRLRLALSTQMWPMAWPVAEAVTLSFDSSFAHLELPVRTTEPNGDVLSPFEPAEAAPEQAHKVLREPSGARMINHDIETGDIIYDVNSDSGELKLEDTDLAYGSTNAQRYVINEASPLSARAEYRADFTFERDDWRVRTESELVVTCDENYFILAGSIAGFEDGSEVFARKWDVKIPRTVY
jgi:uncharacterized protein